MNFFKQTLTSLAVATIATISAFDAPASAFTLTQNGSNPLKFMALGDSNTRGKGSDAAGYRDDLWGLFQDHNYDVDFVGSAKKTGSKTFDRNHQGHGGWSIDGNNQSWAGNLIDEVDNWLDAAMPNVVMLMAGTNDIIFQNESAADTKNDLVRLVDKILAWSEDVYVLVSTIAPMNPNAKETDQVKAQKVVDYNNFIANLLTGDTYQDKNVSFVDHRHVGAEYLLSDGIHYTPEGYTQLAHSWFDAVVDAEGSQEKVASTPEPGSTLSVLVVGAAGVSSLLLKRKQ